ncbi:MAG: PAS domain S-box protein [Fibrobacter sp.]|nr:PAS domain S-box protein [Fibrobacter sp.]
MLDEKLSMVELIQELESLKKQKQYFEEQLARITEISTAIIYTLDLNGYFTYINNAVESILHFKPDELMGKHFSVIMPPDEFERVSRDNILPKLEGRQTGAHKAPKLFDERRTGERRTRSLEVKLITKDTMDVKVLVGDVTGIISLENDSFIAPSSAPSNVISGSHGVIFDITKYKQVEKERMELQKRFFEIQKNDTVGRLAAKVAHDLNNKLGSILGCAEMLRMDCDEQSDAIKYIDTIISASKHAAELSFRLKGLNRKENHESRLIDLHQLLNDVLDLMQPTLDGVVEVQKNYSATEACIYGCYHQLQNAILNIINNACDAMGSQGGNLTVSTSNISIAQDIEQEHSIIRAGRYIRLSIADSGPGMSESIQKQLFEPFFTTKAEGMGVGLGLIGVRDCMKEHGGAVDVKSRPGYGTEIILFLPLIQECTELPS